ncbi:hypothetical protein FRACYDRAFT_222761 [Fragilariopsis cylindrus CCMP1102]|uniref:Antifreeze protein n=1 Tax=Fragilariopsis cylindrus CCMP1102 TaxID=635003 RepID=A0A1E7EJ92_9STRA|nr:hypothetical protein FRACYDRAFT_222761 [Fragilariopsis cylindrus CCMP1102]|eukprot:OEU05978.1 hypothetical protein FRACYDRAFT_222761 [Fragilariopsis cylindrus CCMP1102]
MMKLNLFILSMSAAMVNARNLRTLNADDICSSADLGKAGDYTILSKAGISTVPDSVITGNIAVSPIAATAITGFSLTADPTNKYSFSTQVAGQGKVYAADYAVPTPANLITAVSDMENAYVNAKACQPDYSFVNGEIGDKTFTPGVYTYTKDITINDDDVFIIQTTNRFLQAAGTKMFLVANTYDGSKPLASNIIWQIAEAVIIETSAHVEGTLLAATSVTMKTGSTMNGRILAQTAVSLQKSTITGPA